MTAKQGKIYRQIYAAVAASLLVIANGYHMGWPSPSLAKLQDSNSDISVTSDQGSWIASFQLIGSICGSILGFFIVDKLGRKMSILFAAVPLFVSCILIGAGTTYWMLYIARIIAGIGMEVVFSAAPMYVGEVVEARIRGGTGTLIAVMMSLGVLVPFSIGPWVGRATLAAVGAVIPILSTLVLFWIPESPYYFAMKNIQYKAEKSLIWLRGTNDVDDEMRKINESVAFKINNRGNVLDLFTDRGNRKALIIVVGLLIGQQFSGVSAFMAYTTIIFDEADAGISSNIAVIITGVIQLVVAVLVTFVADRFGRRTLMLSSISLCTVFLLGEALYFQLRSNGMDVTPVSFLPIVFMIGFLVSYQMGIGIVPVVISVELFRMEVKAFAITFCSVLLCAAAIAVTKLYQIISDTWGMYVAFYVFAGCCVLSGIFIFFVVPETNKRSFSEIQEQLQGTPAEPML